MRRALRLLFVAGMLCSGCQDAPRIVYPSPPSTPSIPQTITITATNGIGNSAGQIFLAAMVRDASGRGVGDATVRFTTTAGTVQPATATSDGGGLAQATLTSSSPATITATAGSAVGAISVTPTTSPAPTPPNPSPGPSPSPTPPTQPLTVTILAAPGPAGTATTFSLAAQALQQETWTFGDSSAPVTTTNHVASHVYAAAGTYSVGVSVIDIQGRSATATTNVVIPAPQNSGTPSTSGLVVTMHCTPGAPGSKTSCNLAATFNGANLPSTSTFTTVDWDWGDGISQIVSNSPVGTHVYKNPGTYLAVPHITASTPAGPQMITTSQSLDIK